MRTQGSEARAKNFDEVAVGYSEDEARIEASRCLLCPKRPCTEGCPVGIDIPDFVKALREGLAWSQRDWIETTADTGVGDPAPSTPEKGKKFLDDVSAKIAEFLVELAEADLADLYQD